MNANRLFACLIGLVVLLFVASPAEARRGGVVVLGTSIDRVVDIGEMPVEVQAEMKFHGRVGYIYNESGIWFVTFWTYGGTFCIYDDDQYYPITRDEAAALLNRPADSLSVPFLYTVPLGWIILAGFLGIVGLMMFIFSRFEGVDDEYEQAALNERAPMPNQREMPAPAPEPPGRFRIVGFSANTGDDAEFVIEAGSPAHANQLAERKGVTVSSIERVQ